MKRIVLALVVCMSFCIFPIFTGRATNNYEIEKPYFPGGKAQLDKLFNQYLNVDNFNYLQALKIRFYVDESGKLTRTETLEQKDSFSNRVEKYVESLSGWIPGKSGGTPVGMYDTLTIVYGTVHSSYDIFMQPPVRKVVSEEEYKKYLNLYKKAGNHVFVLAIEKLPEFIGGYSYLMKYLNDNLRYPEEEKAKGTDGVVIVRFLVEENGKISNASVEKSLSPACDKEALRLVYSMPKWVAGVRMGETVEMYFDLPILFSPDN